MIEVMIMFLSALVLYHHVVFPLILKTIRKPALKLSSTSQDYPEITLIIPAHNEEACVAEKIFNTASLDYPQDKLKVLLVCDGCRDNTRAQAEWALSQPEAHTLNLTICDHPINRGKIAILNEAISQSNSPLIALSDCSSLLSLDALLRFACHFTDLRVGVVGGTYRLLKTLDPAEEIYWRYQRAVKEGEAALGAPMGMHGSFYGFRKSLCAPLAPSIINDDFILPMKIVAQGYRAIYDTEIISLETQQTTTAMNWQRRVRIAAGNMQQALHCLDLLRVDRAGVGVAFCFFSGKFLRAVMPFALLTIVGLSALASVTSLFYLCFFLLQLLGLTCLFLPIFKSGRLMKLTQTARYIVIGHSAGFVGSLRYLSGRTKGPWKRAQ